MIDLSPTSLLAAYARGAFPMADEDGVIRFYTADPRGVLPLDAFHIPRTLRQIIRQGRFEIRVNHDFRSVMRACMQTRPDRSWINAEMIDAFTRLSLLGHAHSVEAWRDGQLAGGLYGVSLGGAFFGESMFHYQTDAGKVALVALVDRLVERNFILLDTQTVSTHLEKFGAVQISESDYLQRLKQATQLPRRFA